MTQRRSPARKCPFPMALLIETVYTFVREVLRGIREWMGMCGA